MTVVVIVLVGIAVAAARAVLKARGRRGSAGRASARSPLARRTGPTGIVAAREIRERVRGRVFRVGTLLILAVVAAAIVVPTLTKSTPQPQRVGVVGTLSAESRSTVAAAARSVGTSVRFVDEPDAGAARAQLDAGTLDLAIVDGRALVVNETISSTDTSTSARFVAAAAAGARGAQRVRRQRVSPRRSPPRWPRRDHSRCTACTPCPPSRRSTRRR